MDPKIVLQKTRKGEEELTTRHHGLSPALRMVLILVDGACDVTGLKNKAASLANLEDYLEQLIESGFVDDRDQLAAEGTVAATEAKDESASVTAAKWLMVDMIKNVIGEEHGERATNRFMAIDDTPEALTKALDECCELIKLTMDEERAEIVKQTGVEIISRL